jgi:hypothetical protein
MPLATGNLPDGVGPDVRAAARVVQGADSLLGAEIMRDTPDQPPRRMLPLA